MRSSLGAQLGCQYRETLAAPPSKIRTCAGSSFRIALKHLRYSCEFFAPLFDNAEMMEYAKAVAGLQDAFGFINDFHVALSRLQGWVKQDVITRETREAIAAWHTPHAQTVLADALHLAEAVMSRCQPWCTECERRGLTGIRRRIQHDIKLQLD